VRSHRRYKMIEVDCSSVTLNETSRTDSIGIGRDRGSYQGMTREWLYWYDEQGQRILTPEEQIAHERQIAQQERQRAKLLEERLRSLGVDPDNL